MSQINQQKKYITIKGKKKTYKLTIEECSRWMSLIEAVDHIDKKAQQLNINLKNVEWTKPIALVDFIESRSDAMQEAVEKYEQVYSLIPELQKV